MSPQRVFHQLRIAEVISETDDACSLVFMVPPELSGEFAYHPGQFLTVRVPAADGSVARCYSLSSSPHTGDRHTITVKRAGYASNWLADNVTAGSVLDALPPAGTFTPRSLDTDLLMFAGGSGITPIMSIVKSALARGRGRIVLIYTNRDERSVIFSRELRRLAADTRLLVLHWLDSLQGPPTAAAMAALARPYAAHEAFLCGPDPYLTIVRQALSQLGVPAQRIHTERFLSLAENPFEEQPPADSMAATLEVTLDGEKRVLPWPAGTRMLDVLIDEGLDAPFSCRQGICGACACQLTGGEVKMANNEVLEEADVADGYILACQAVPLTPEVSITY
ncbi:MAG TPA: ferredoxin--NADP reductase [Streptosporangiaceae bacterium]|nr:ferredoxin--NADP reductase [Streptosporangiaceae bacterium]